MLFKMGISIMHMIFDKIQFNTVGLTRFAFSQQKCKLKVDGYKFR